MEKVLLYGLPILLFCAVAQGLWCFHNCGGSNPCIPHACYACGEDQCYEEKRVYDTLKEDVKTLELLQVIQSSGSFLAQPFGCTTAENRHLCNTTREIAVLVFGRRNVTVGAKFVCCNTFRCNDPKGTPRF